jgi:hypothetical protein
MTVLSRALTGEKPTDRFEDIRDLVEDLQKCGCPKKLIDVMLREHFTNERALFIAAMRGEIKVTEPSGGEESGPSAEVEGRDKDAVTGTPASKPPEPPKPAQDDAERTALIKRLQDYNAGLRLPYEVYERLKEMYADRHVEYPNGAVDRLEYLRALPFSWLQYIVTGRNDIPKPVVQR